MFWCGWFLDWHSWTPLLQPPPQIHQQDGMHRAIQISALIGQLFNVTWNKSSNNKSGIMQVSMHSLFLPLGYNLIWGICTSEGKNIWYTYSKMQMAYSIRLWEKIANEEFVSVNNIKSDQSEFIQFDNIPKQGRRTCVWKNCKIKPWRVKRSQNVTDRQKHIRPRTRQNTVFYGL